MQTDKKPASGRTQFAPTGTWQGGNRTVRAWLDWLWRWFWF